MVDSISSTEPEAQPEPEPEAVSRSSPPTAVLVTEHMNEVIENLWVGNLMAASDTERLKRERVRHVVSVLRGSVDLPDKIDRLTIPIDDIPQADILSFLPEAVQFVKDGLEKGEGVLIHCQAGMSRSATVAAAYLMANRGLSVDEAVEAVRAKRCCTLPSESFLNQLDVFQKGGYKVSAKDRSTRAFFRKRIVENMMNGNDSPPETTYFASVSLSSPTGLERRRLRCSSCRSVSLNHHHHHHTTGACSEIKSFDVRANDGKDRKVLALREHTLHPSTVPSEPSTSDNPSSFSLNNPTNEDGAARHPSVVNGHGNVHGRGGAIIVNSACSGYFLEPMEWMKPIFESGQLNGKIICPNERCGSKIGNFDWAGQCCGCKDWVVPGFCLTRSKVDEIAF